MSADRDRRPDDDFEDPTEHPIEAGRPQLENILFVLLGVVLTILVLLRGIGLL